VAQVGVCRIKKFAVLKITRLILFCFLQKTQEKTVTALKRMVPHGPDVVVEAVGAHAGHTLPYPAGL